MQCPKCDQALKKIHTKQGVIVDFCDACKGLWLDEGEIFMFSKTPKWLKKILDQGLISPHPSDRTCPFCRDKKMVEGGFVQPDLLIDQCPACNGLWFDDGELKKALELGSRKFQLSMAQDQHGPFYAEKDTANQARWQASRVAPATGASERQRHDALRAGMIALPNLGIRSAASFLMLYGMGKQAF